MSRIKLTEYRAKKIVVGDDYEGRAIRTGKEKFPPGRFVIKVDQGVKKRAKQGLLAINVNAAEAKKHIAVWKKKGYTQFLAEPLMAHDVVDEQYLSFERVRDGVRVLHARQGGIEIESNPDAVRSFLVRGPSDVKKIAEETDISVEFISHVLTVFEKNFFAFLEINPLVLRNGTATPLDAAVLVDSAGTFFMSTWSEDDMVKQPAKHTAEERVEQLAATTPASLKLNVLNKDGALFFLLSGGGGSIVIADEAQLEGVGHLIGNYGEYSGGPTREETFLYAKEVIALMLASKSKKKALVIAGGVANFTDVKKTFAGIIEALSEKATELRKQSVKVFVRRGGPNEAAGLALMKDFLEKEGLLGSVHGSDAIITQAVADAIKIIK